MIMFFYSVLTKYNKCFYQSDIHDNKQLATRGTNYAKNVDNNCYKIWASHSSKWNNGNTDFWLRSPGYFQFDAAYVFNDGDLSDNGYIVDNRDYGVRPALWVNIE